MAQKVPVSYLKDEHVPHLLKSRDWGILSHAITVAGKLGYRSELLKLLEENNFKWDYEEYAVIDALAKMDPPAIYEIKHLQRHRSSSIRENATLALKNIKFRLQQEDPQAVESPYSPLRDIEEPNLVVERIDCPRCKRTFPVDVPKDVDVLKVHMASWLHKLSRKTNLFVECPRCHHEIFVDTGKSLSRQIVEEMEKARNVRQDFHYQDEYFQHGADSP
jgi:Zn finger protein HypA/HybF involved in hydrogenase expression